MKYNTLYKLLETFKIVIPIIQRDYAQGRDTELELRNNFLKKIKLALDSIENPLNLDFIYGYTDQQGNDLVFIPLDGQQRLTTLWLIHWYFAFKENIISINEDNKSNSNSVQKILHRFTYETRVSSSRFCENLILKPLQNFNEIESFSEKIKDAAWYMASWNNDPTIVSMLNMLDTIHTHLRDCKDGWEKLVVKEKITFDYIDIKSDEFKLNDELYIKMNSRGKPLTSFEQFKAQFSDLLVSKNTDYFKETLTYEKTNISFQQYFAFKIDSVWMDLFWSYNSKTELKIDDCILNYIYYVAEVLYYKNNSEENIKDFEKKFESLESIFSKKENSLFLFDSLDLLSSLSDVQFFFDELFSNHKSTHDQVVLFENETTDFFLRVITNTKLEVKHRTLFYALLSYCIKTKTILPNNNLRKFIRIIRNMLLASRQVNGIKRIEYTTDLRLPKINEYANFIDGFVEMISKSPNKDVYSILKDCNLNGFKKDIINAEKSKAEVLINKSELEHSIFELEDHPEIQGNISSFNFDSDNISEKVKAFKEIWDDGIDSSLITRSFLTEDDFSILIYEYSPLGEIWYFGSQGSWNRILTSSEKNDNIKISEILDRFLSSYMKIDGDQVEHKLNNLISDYLKKNKVNRDWRYYFIKYAHINSNYGNLFNLFSWKGEGFDINNIGNSGKNPLSSYHLNPYVYALSKELSHLSESKLYWGRYSNEISFLSIKDKANFYSISEGWKIVLHPDYSLAESLSNKYWIENNSGLLILKENNEKDRIEIACEFINELLNEF